MEIDSFTSGIDDFSSLGEVVNAYIRTNEGGILKPIFNDLEWQRIIKKLYESDLPDNKELLKIYGKLTENLAEYMPSMAILEEENETFCISDIEREINSSVIEIYKKEEEIRKNKWNKELKDRLKTLRLMISEGLFRKMQNYEAFRYLYGRRKDYLEGGTKKEEQQNEERVQSGSLIAEDIIGNKY